MIRATPAPSLRKEDGAAARVCIGLLVSLFLLLIPGGSAAAIEAPPALISAALSPSDGLVTIDD
ncbi:hypothetical protein, partial [Knoellia flava]